MNRRILDIAVMLICTSIFLWCAVAYINNKETIETNNIVQESQEDAAELVDRTQADLIVWYSDSKILPYLEEATSLYSAGMNIDLVEVSVLDYLENINKLNVKGEGMPDLYILDSEMLEQAYLAGLTLEIKDDTYNEDHFPAIALNAATYNNQLIAYPFYFDTSFFVYNKDYVKNEISTFDDILTFANEFDGESKPEVQNILKWDVKDLLYNYAFVGEYLEFGGDSGDDATKIELNNPEIVKSLEYYHNLYQYFSIDINTIDYDTIVDEFIQGKTVFTILGVDSIAKLNKSEINYKIIDFPALNSELKAKSLSATKVIAINPYTKDKHKAIQFAKYLSYEKAGLIYELTGYMGTRKFDSYEVEGLNEVMKQYQESASLPKLMSARDFWVQLQNTLNNVWTGEDIQTTLQSLENKYIN